MPSEWDITDDEIDSWPEEWEALDQAAAAYLAERIPGVRDVLTHDDARWLDAVAETISPSEEPRDQEIESVSAVMALQHADWLGLALGVAHRGPGSALDPEVVQADIERLDDVEGEIEDPEGYLAVLEMALLHLTPRWQGLGVLDQDQRLTERGAWGLPRALHRAWSDKAQPPGRRARDRTPNELSATVSVDLTDSEEARPLIAGMSDQTQLRVHGGKGLPD